jgi:hypothetical protein
MVTLFIVSPPIAWGRHHLFRKRRAARRLPRGLAFQATATENARRHSGADTMPRVGWSSCGFSMSMTRKELEVGMIYPECDGNRLRPPIKARPGRRLSGPVVLLLGLQNLHGKAGYPWARAIALGVLLIVGAVVFITAGAHLGCQGEARGPEQVPT